MVSARSLLTRQAHRSPGALEPKQRWLRCGSYYVRVYAYTLKNQLWCKRKYESGDGREARTPPRATPRPKAHATAVPATSTPRCLCCTSSTTAARAQGRATRGSGLATPRDKAYIYSHPARQWPVTQLLKRGLPRQVSTQNSTFDYTGVCPYRVLSRQN